MPPQNTPSSFVADDTPSSFVPDESPAHPVATVSAAPPKWSIPWLEGRAMTLRDQIVNQLPTVGGILGGIVGGGAGAETGPGAIATGAAGAAAGGGLGEDLRQSLMEHFHPEDKKMTPGQVLAGLASQAVGQGASEAAGRGVGKIFAPTLERTINKLYYANRLGPGEDLERVMPEILAEEKTAPAKTIGDFVESVNRAKTKIGNEVDLSLRTPVATKTGTQPLASLPASGQPIADEIRNLVNAHPSEIEMNPRKIAAIKERALSYERGDRTFAWLYDRRAVLNKELNKFYAITTPEGKAQFLHDHPDFEIDKAEADAIRSVVYPEMDRAAGKPPGYFENLQRKRGALMSVEEQSKKNLENLKPKTRQTKGAPLLEKANIGASASVTGRPHAWIGNLIGSVHPPNPLHTANRRVASAFGHTAASKVGSLLGSTPGVEVMSLPLRELIPEETEQ